MKLVCNFLDNHFEYLLWRYKMKNVLPFLIVMIALVLASLACGSVEVG